MYLELPNLELLEYKFQEGLKATFPDNRSNYFDNEVLGIFKQTWSNTSMGFQGIGGSAMTSAYTTVFINREYKVVGVFWDEKLGYLIENPNDKFYDHLKDCKLSGKSQMIQYKKEG